MAPAVTVIGAAPMLSDERLVQFGYDETDPDSNSENWARMRPGLVRFSGPEVRADPAGCATRALAALTAAGAMGTALSAAG